MIRARQEDPGRQEVELELGMIQMAEEEHTCVHKCVCTCARAPVGPCGCMCVSMCASM